MDVSFPIIMMLALYAVLMFALLYMIGTGRKKFGLVVKTSMSALFILIAVFVIFAAPAPPEFVPQLTETGESAIYDTIRINNISMGAVAIVLGLIASLVGDYALGYAYMKSKDRRWDIFNRGVAAFSIAMIFYIAATAIYGKLYYLSFVIAAVISIGFVLMNKKYMLGNSSAQMTIPYTFLLGSAMINSVLIFFMGPGSNFNTVFMIGIILFFISDYALFEVVFKREPYSHTLNYVNKITYFSGQVIIALSLLCVF